MDTQDDSYADLSSAEAFDVLGHETRLDILRTLADRASESAESSALTFSELREHVDVADSGLFNHHLQRLVGTFVRRTDDGYELGHAGSRIVARSAGHRGEAFETDRSGTECGVCGEPDCERSIHVHLELPWA
jgi:DNA-binding transcriptional ArsR family regulator